jgi:hypothetical protein
VTLLELHKGDKMLRNVYNILVGNPEGKRPLGRHRRRWEDNIVTDIMEIKWGVLHWIHPAQDRDQWRVVSKAVMKLWTQ